MTGLLEFYNPGKKSVFSNLLYVKSKPVNKNFPSRKIFDKSSVVTRKNAFLDILLICALGEVDTPLQP